MTTHEHRRIAALAILVSAEGPLTVTQIHGRLHAIGHGQSYASLSHDLVVMIGRGTVEARVERPGSGIYWPTSLGRHEAELHEARIEGV